MYYRKSVPTIKMNEINIFHNITVLGVHPEPVQHRGISPQEHRGQAGRHWRQTDAGDGGRGEKHRPHDLRGERQWRQCQGADRVRGQS